MDPLVKPEDDSFEVPSLSYYFLSLHLSFYSLFFVLSSEKTGTSILYSYQLI
jgi:hypothetical protein